MTISNMYLHLPYAVMPCAQYCMRRHYQQPTNISCEMKPTYSVVIAAG